MSLFLRAYPVETKKGKVMNPPLHLTPETATFWRTVMEEFELEEHHIRLLILACEAYDAAQEDRKVLQNNGKVFVDRFGQPKPRPEVAIQRDSAISFARLLRELDLDVNMLAARSRPPALVSNRVSHA